MTTGKQLGTAEIAFDEVAEVSLERKVFVLTGDFASGSKADIEAKINARGGSVKDSVTAKTDYLVVGNDGSAAWVNGVAGGKKVVKAMELKAKGNAISIINESAILNSVSDSVAGHIDGQSAEPEQVGEIIPIVSPVEYFEYVIVDDGVEITKYLGFEKTVIVPETIAGLSVVSFGGNSFVVYGNHETERVCIPNSLVRLHARAFQNGVRNVYFSIDDNHPNLVVIENSIYNKNMTELFYSTNWSETELIVPDTVEIIHDYAFEGHRNLKKVQFSCSLKKLGKAAFFNCYEFKRIDLPVSLVEIGDKAFDSDWHDVSNSKIFVPQNVSEIGGFTGRKLQISKDNKFLHVVNNLVLNEDLSKVQSILSTDIKEIIIPETVKSVAAKLFIECEGLNTITFGENVSEISNAHFLSRINIKFSKKNKTFRNDDKVLYQILADGKERLLLCYKKGIRKYEVPKQVVEICDFAFSGCDQLKELTLNEGLVRIGKNAFDNTIRLERITLPLSVVDLEDYNKAFEIDEYHPNYLSDKGVIYKKLANNNLLLLKATDKSLTNYEMLPNTTEMLRKAFQYCLKLTSIKFSNLITRIPEEAFEYSGITELQFPDVLTVIDISAFRECNKLMKVELNENVRVIGNYAFAACPKHTAFTIKPENQSFTIINGILFDKNVSRVVAVPQGIVRTDLKIPQTVSMIGKAFGFCSKIKKVTLPNSLTEIPPYAFSNCTSLTEIILPDGLKRIGDSAFICTKIEKLVVPSSVEFIGESIFSINKNVKIIGHAGSTAEKYILENNNANHKFEQIGALKEVREVNRDYNYEVLSDGIRILKYIGKKVDELNVPETIDEKPVIEIGDDAFSRKSIAKINLPDTIIKLGEHAFSFNKQLIEINIPKELTKIPLCFVYGCSNLENIFIPPSVVEIQYSAFEDTLISDLVIPETVKKIHSDVFNYRQKVVIKGTKGSAASRFAQRNGHIFVDLNQNITEDDVYYAQCFETENIGKNAIRITKLQTDKVELAIPEKILNRKVEEVIVQYGYKDAETVRSLTIPVTVKLLDIDFKNIFENLEKIVVIDGNKRYFTNEYGLFDRIEKSLIYVFDKSINSMVVPEGITTIKKYAGSNIIKLDELVLPNSLRMIESNAFHNDGWGGWRSNAIKINEVNIPIDVEDIGNDAFPKSIPIHVHVENKSYLSDSHCLYKYLEDGNLNLMYCFDDELSEYTVHPGTIRIMKHAFNNHNNLTSIKFLSELQSIEFEAFKNCSALQSIDFPKGLNNIAQGAFMYCQSIQQIKLPDGIQKIANYSFTDCRGLEKVQFSDNLEEIGEFAFSGCTSLKTVEFPLKLRKIHGRAFGGCKGIDRVELPLGIEIVEKTAFENCEVVVNTSDSQFEIWIFDNGIYLRKGIEYFIFKYDESLKDLKEPPSKIKGAITRLNSPYLLSEDFKRAFVDYIKRYYYKLDDYSFLGRLNKKWFTIFDDNEIITKSNVDKMIEFAKDNDDLEAVAFLINYKEVHFGNASKTYRL